LPENPPTDEKHSSALREVSRRFAIPALSVVVVLAFIAIVTVRWDDWISDMSIQTTDDAYIRAETTRLSARVSGAVLSVDVNDFQRVKAGEVLVQIDPADYEAQVAQSEAGVLGAQAALDNLANEIELQYSTIAQTEAERGSVSALDLEAHQEQQRQQILSQTDAGTRQKLEQATAAYAKAEADLRVNAALIAAQKHQLEVLNGTKKQRAAEVAAAEASLEAARLRLGYTRIVAPFDGVAGERLVQSGDYVNIGSNLISLVPLPQVYIIANYKETQLKRVRQGQHVQIRVDTFRDETLQGRVQRIAPASGAQFALLPPDNATGNYTKVVQRIPVRIELNPGQPLIERLLPGMSVTTRIDVEAPYEDPPAGKSQ
jgi:membrane fusion protein, multidrug efflux system